MEAICHTPLLGLQRLGQWFDTWGREFWQLCEKWGKLTQLRRCSLLEFAHWLDRLEVSSRRVWTSVLCSLVLALSVIGLGRVALLATLSLSLPPSRVIGAE